MTPAILFGAIVLGPVLLTLLLRVNAAVVFMSLCVGEVLVQYVAPDTSSLMHLLSSHSSQVSDSTVKLVLLLLPATLTLIFMFHSVRGFRLILNVFPALGAGLLGTLLVKPLLSAGFQHTLEQSPLWHQFTQAQTLVVSSSALLSLFFLWIARHGGGHGKDHHGKHH